MGIGDWADAESFLPQNEQILQHSQTRTNQAGFH